MAPRTRRLTQRLANINAEYAQDQSPNLEQVKDNSATEESGNFYSLDKGERAESDRPAAESTSNTKSITSRNKRQMDSRDPRVMFGPKSKLTKLDVSKFLSDEKAWASLTSDQQAVLKSMCPKDSAWGKSTLEQPTLGFLHYDMHWKSDVRTYTENMADGYYDPDWIQEAEKAALKRKDGKFDDWKLKNFEEYWGQKMDPERKEYREKGQIIVLSDLVADGQLQIGDEWSYSRSFGRGKKVTIITHNFKMTSMDDYGKAHFQICLPADTKNLKRLSDNAKDEDGAYGKHVKIMFGESDKTQQQSTVSSIGSTTIDNLHTTGTDPDSIMTDTFDRNDLTSQGSPSALTKYQSTQLALHTGGNLATSHPLRSILKKPSMAMFSIVVAKVEDLERELLRHGGDEQNLGKTDAWKHFTIRRGGKDVGSLQTLRDEYQKKLAR